MSSTHSAISASFEISVSLASVNINNLTLKYSRTENFNIDRKTNSQKYSTLSPSISSRTVEVSHSHHLKLTRPQVATFVVCQVPTTNPLFEKLRNSLSPTIHIYHETVISISTQNFSAYVIFYLKTKLNVECIDFINLQRMRVHRIIYYLPIRTIDEHLIKTFRKPKNNIHFIIAIQSFYVIII